MPIYTFDCGECGHETEIFSGIESRPDVIECEECSAEAKWRSINWRPPPKQKNSHVVYGKGQSSEEFLKKNDLFSTCATHVVTTLSSGSKAPHRNKSTASVKTAQELRLAFTKSSSICIGLDSRTMIVVLA